MEHEIVSALITENQDEWHVFILFSQKLSIRVLINEDVQSNCGLWCIFIQSKFSSFTFSP